MTYSHMDISNEISTVERTTYYLYILGQNILYCLVYTYGSLFYTDYAKIPAEVIGTIFIFARIIDAFFDPFFGKLVDRVNIKNSKYKFWSNIASIALPLCTIFIFTIPNQSLTIKILYTAISYTLWGMIYTISDNPGFGLTITMTANNIERNSLLSRGRTIVYIAFLIGMSNITILGKNIGWVWTGIFYATAAILLMNPARFTIKERHCVSGIKKKFDLLKYLPRNRHLLSFLIFFILWYSFNLSITLTSYFAIYVLGSIKYIPVLNVINMGSALIFSIVTQYISKLFDKRKIVITSFSLLIICYVAFYLAGYKNIVFVYLMQILIGGLPATCYVLVGVFLGDCVDYGRDKTGHDAGGTVFSLMTFCNKAGQTISAAASLFLLKAIGYIPNIQQSGATIKSIFMLMNLVPALGLFLGLSVFMLFYGLDENTLNKIRRRNTKASEYQLLNSD